MGRRHTAILCLGSNVSPRHERIEQAIGCLSEFVTVISMSEYSESCDITGIGKPYINVAIHCTTELSLDRLNEKIAEVEIAGGRTADARITGFVTIDIDLVIWDNKVISPGDLAQPYFTPLYQQVSKVRREIKL